MIPKRIERLVRLDDDTGCWIWKGYRAGTVPQINVDGRGRSAKRAVYAMCKGKEIPRSKFATGCRHSDACVNPDHIKVTTKAGYQKLAVERGKCMTAVTKAKLVAAKRARSKLGWEKVRAIRASTDTDAAEARKHGIAESHVYRIRNYQSWREPGLASMLAQMRRL